MTSTVVKANFSVVAKFREAFRSREIFLHDGRSLRRIAVDAKVQLTAAAALVAVLVWSILATVQAANAASGDIATMQREVAKMEAEVAAVRQAAAQQAALLEQRQAFLARMLSGDADSAELARLLPAAHAHDHAHPAADAVEGEFAQVAGQQDALIQQAQAATEARVRDTASALRRMGLNPARFTGQGGPLEPIATATNADPRFRELFSSWRQAEQLEQGVVAIPSAKPVSDGNFTSGFGVRSDPFRGRAAFHAGIDVAGPVGTPIYATADGIVGRSEYAGAYGNLIELNHGQGIQTRYGHLSRSAVRSGERVRRGQLIGYMGSTGRSTGSHLHYEVRIDGRAVNPIPFIESNQTLMALQRRANTPPVAMGGPASASR